MKRGHAFLCVPLIGKGEVPGKKILGVLIVDNCFLINEREIQAENISSLEAFAGMMALSIEIESLLTRLEKEARLRNWEEFAARTGHTIGTRISIIEGTLFKLNESLKQEILDDEYHIRTLMDNLKVGIDKAKRVLKDLSRLMSPIKLNYKHVDLEELIINMLYDIRHLIYCKIKQDFRVRELYVDCDPDRIAESLIELIDNAQDAMQDSVEKLISIRLSKPSDDIAQIEVEDTGSGISLEIKDQVFEPFSSTKEKDDSRASLVRGLGLAVVQKTIEEQGGTITVYSEPGKGARFVIRLPLSKERLANAP